MPKQSREGILNLAQTPGLLLLLDHRLPQLGSLGFQMDLAKGKAFISLFLPPHHSVAVVMSLGHHNYCWGPLLPNSRAPSSQPKGGNGFLLSPALGAFYALACLNSDYTSLSALH